MTKNGGHAFPTEYMASSDRSGMTLRDWFAGQALASIAERDDWFPNVIAARAYAVADAMLVERTKATGA